MISLKFPQILYGIGLALLVGGILDPLEGSIVIWIGSGLLTLSYYLRKDALWRKLFFATLLITIGIGMMFLLSDIGGIGGNSPYSIWLGLLILPYPIGWIGSLLWIIQRALQNKKRGSVKHAV